MIWREGGCLDGLRGSVWVRLEYDGCRNAARVWIRDGYGGMLLVMCGCAGSSAKRFYDRLNVYFFGYE